MRAVLLALAGLGLAAATAGAYSRSTITDSDPTPVAWDFSGGEVEIQGGRLVFRLHPAGSDDIFDGSDLLAIEDAFRAWEDVPDTAIAFARGADFSDQVVANDGVFPVFWVEDSSIVDQGTPDTSDDVDVSGSLAVTFTSWWVGGPSDGELADANIVFNGFDFTWTTDPETEPAAFDIASVAVHEIGHALGFGHSAVGGASLFPRTAVGTSRARSLSRDDIAAAGDAHGDANWTASTARVSGVVRAGGLPLFGAHVVIEDATGNVVAGAVTLADGSYVVDGLPAGPLSAWAEPLDRDDPSTVLFSERNLPRYWRTSGIDVDFRTGSVTPFLASLGGVSQLDFDLSPASPGLNITLVGQGGGFLSNSPGAVLQGAKDFRVSVAGPVAEMPSSGTPLSVTGGGITPKSTSFQTISGGTLRVVHLIVDVDPDAVIGLRSLVIDDGTERTVASGHLEILEAVEPPADTDGDTVADSADNCPSVPNASQGDADSDGVGDPCDPCPDDPLDDADSDGHCADADNCPVLGNPSQADADADGAGDACDPCPFDSLDDADSDGHCADVDNCPAQSNPGQADADGDGAGDPCDPCPLDPLDDAESDGHCADVDNCPATANPGQEDLDLDGRGDACDPCPADSADDADSDGVCADTDNCPLDANPGQEDADGDGLGDACDPCPADPQDRCITVDLLRNGELSSRSLSDHATIFVLGENGGLDPVDDFAVGDIGTSQVIVLSGEGAAVGEGNPGVVIFYDVRGKALVLELRRRGPDIELRGW